MTTSAPVLAQSHALDAEQQAFFHRHGYLILRALAGPSEFRRPFRQGAPVSGVPDA